MQILQITDPHLYGNAGGNLRGVETDSSLRTVLDSALADDDEFAAILVTGDLVQDDASGYLRLKSILGNLQLPVLCIPGNHDEPDIMRTSLADEPFHYCGAHSFGGWNLVMLDSYDAGHVGGRLTHGELSRLDSSLTACTLPALVCLHHHPVPTGSRWLDKIGLVNAGEFWDVIDAHRHVRGVAWGHVHQEYDGERNGVRLTGTPSTCAQFVPHSDRYVVDSRPPAYRRFTLHPDGRIDSEIRWVHSQPLHLASAR